MEKKNTSVFYNALIWGVIIGLVSIVYSLVLYMLDQTLNRALGYAGLIIPVIGLIIAMISYRNNVLDGVMPFGQAFGFGLLIIVFSGLLGAIFTYLLYTVIDTGLQEKMLEFTTEKMLERGVPEGQIDQALEMTKKFMSPVVISISAFVTSCLGGVILSLIIAAIFKKEEA